MALKLEGARMAVRIDDTDRKIMAELQRDAGRSLDDIAKAVGSSKTPVWNRIRKLREAGIIGPQTVRLDADALGQLLARTEVALGRGLPLDAAAYASSA